MTWRDQLRRASFRGVPFGALATDGRFGRRTAIHDYPYRDTVWAEDLGRSARGLRVTGFLVEESGIYGGGDVIAQRDRLIGVAEAPGDAELVHPTFGRLTVALLSMSYAERWDRGRYIEFTLDLVEAGQRVFPSVVVSTPDQTVSAATRVDGAAARAWVARTKLPLGYGGSITSLVEQITHEFVEHVTGVGQDATGLFGLSSLLPGEFGRYWGGRGLSRRTDLRVGILGPVSTIAQLVELAAGARSDIGVAATVLEGAAAGLGLTTAADFAIAVQGLVGTALAATGSPRDGVRAMASVAAFAPAHVTTSSAIGKARATAQSATADLTRRAAASQAAKAAAAWDPPSFDAAVEVRSQIVALLDIEIEAAGDQEEDEAFLDLKALRAAVVTDLTARAANLARMVEIRTPAPVPALALAYRLYEDIGRAEELTLAAGSPHPAFLATEFMALSA